MRKERYGLLAKKPRANKEYNPPTELYRTCSQLPLDRFIDCLIDNDLSRLVIKGEVNQSILQHTWDEINIEYIELNQSNDSIYSLGLQKDIALLSDEIQRVEEVLFLLSPAMRPYCLGYENELVGFLRYYGYKQVIDFNSDYSRVLIAIQNKLNPKKLRLDSRIQELTNYLESKSTGKADRKLFETNLIRMSRFQGYAIRAKDITVTEYVIIFRECISQNEKEGVA